MSKKTTKVNLPGEMVIKTNKTMQGIIFVNKKTGEERIYLAEMNMEGVDNIILGPNANTGEIKNHPAKTIKQYFTITDRRSEPSGKLFNNS